MEQGQIELAIRKYIEDKLDVAYAQVAAEISVIAYNNSDMIDIHAGISTYEDIPPGISSIAKVSKSEIVNLDNQGIIEYLDSENKLDKLVKRYGYYLNMKATILSHSSNSVYLYEIDSSNELKWVTLNKKSVIYKKYIVTDSRLAGLFVKILDNLEYIRESQFINSKETRYDINLDTVREIKVSSTVYYVFDTLERTKVSLSSSRIVIRKDSQEIDTETINKVLAKDNLMQ